MMSGDETRNCSEEVSEQLQRMMAEVLHGGAKYQNRFRDAGMICPLLALLTWPSSSHDLLCLALDTLATLASGNQINQKAICGAGNKGLQTIVATINNQPALIVCKAIRTLSAVSSGNKEVKRDVGKSGVLITLCDLIDTFDEILQESTLLALSTIVDDDEKNKEVVFKRKAHHRVMKIINNTHSERVTVAALIALRTLLYNQPKKRLRECGKLVMSDLVMVLQNVYRGVVEHGGLLDQLTHLMLDLIHKQSKNTKLLWDSTAIMYIITALLKDHSTSFSVVLSLLGILWEFARKRKRVLQLQNNSPLHHVIVSMRSSNDASVRAGVLQLWKKIWG
eukprot:TRINITY_DN13351_c0_g1_i1.p1 TRINITY_DN13351_c0_g1~~TRINITY_DN13351_c0_g1_i1.p1  ORF type:complete len:355 (+),score=37.55 TRINITY_DN13351_c0_g1_i1:59-1066(+)